MFNKNKNFTLQRNIIIVLYTPIHLLTCVRQMKINSSTNAINAFSPTKFLGNENHTQHRLHSGIENKAIEKIVCERMSLRENESDKIKLNKSVNKSAQVCFGGFFNANNLYK